VYFYTLFSCIFTSYDKYEIFVRGRKYLFFTLYQLTYILLLQSFVKSLAKFFQIYSRQFGKICYVLRNKTAKKRFGTGRKKMPLSENRLCLKIFIFHCYRTPFRGNHELTCVRRWDVIRLAFPLYFRFPFSPRKRSSVSGSLLVEGAHSYATRQVRRYKVWS